MTTTFRMLYVFVVIDHGARRLLHLNVTSHPTAAWTLQQFREALGYEDRYRYLIHDRDSIFAKSLDESIERLGLKVLKSPPRSPKANAICERAIGTIRRECLDWLIPMSEAHLRAILKDWRTHYNGSRPHMALGPGVPDPPPKTALFQARQSRHRLATASSCARNPCWAGCITSIHWCRLPVDPIFAEDSGKDAAAVAKKLRELAAQVEARSK